MQAPSSCVLRLSVEKVMLSGQHQGKILGSETLIAARGRNRMGKSLGQSAQQQTEEGGWPRVRRGVHQFPEYLILKRVKTPKTVRPELVAPCQGCSWQHRRGAFIYTVFIISTWCSPAQRALLLSCCQNKAAAPRVEGSAQTDVLSSSFVYYNPLTRRDINK